MCKSKSVTRNSVSKFYQSKNSVHVRSDIVLDQKTRHFSKNVFEILFCNDFVIDPRSLPSFTVTLEESLQ